MKVRVGIIGIGDRGVSFVRGLRDYADLAEVSGIYDTNRPRMEAMARHCDFGDIPLHDQWEDFAALPHDIVMVTTPDNTHADVIERCLDNGWHVFADKPLANTAEGLTRIMQAYDRHDRMLLMGFNLRCHPVIRKMKEIVQRGELGNIKVAACEHAEQGIRYFRRWHKYRDKTGGLIVHKGCHQLDILNWLIGSHPVEVYAQGDLAVFKGEKTVKGCHACDEVPHCPYTRQLGLREAQALNDMYIVPSAVDGYSRDYCPIGNDATVPDYYLVTIRYANGVRVSYNEVHFSGRSDIQWAFYGDQARMTVRRDGKSSVIERTSLLTQETASYDVPPAAGGHGGADPVMLLEMITSVQNGRSTMPPAEAGVRSAVIGIAAMRSIDENRPVRIEELVPLEYITRAPETGLTHRNAMESMGYQGGAR